MADNQAIDVDEVQEGKPAKKKKAAGGGAKPPILVIVSLAVAVGAIAFSALLFLQLNGLKSRLEEGGTMAVPGEEHGEGEMHADAEHGEHGEESDGNYVVPAEGVLYDLGEIVSNTADNKFVKMSMILELESLYDRHEWEVYEAMMDKYDEGVTLYRNYQLGLDEHGNPKDGGKGGHAVLPPDTGADDSLQPAGEVQVVAAVEDGNVETEVVPAMHGAPKEAPPPEMPELPGKPRSLMETMLMENDSRIRDMINDEVTRTLAEDFIRPSGKDLFKDNIRIKINDIIGEQYGRVTDVLLPSIVSS
ncbi:flagellar basal body-associated FliL family protein [bacterium]|nr:flagellar basal body-associated FliL family protein [bacterium]